MVLAVDNKSKRIIASVQEGGGIKEYESIITGCENPVCTCETAYLYLIPTEIVDENKDQLPPRKVEVDIIQKSLGYKNKKNISKEELRFAQQFFSQLDENDFQVLYKSYFAFKNNLR